MNSRLFIMTDESENISDLKISDLSLEIAEIEAKNQEFFVQARAGNLDAMRTLLSQKASINSAVGEVQYLRLFLTLTKSPGEITAHSCRNSGRKDRGGFVPSIVQSANREQRWSDKQYFPEKLITLFCSGCAHPCIFPQSWETWNWSKSSVLWVPVSTLSTRHSYFLTMRS